MRRPRHDTSSGKDASSCHWEDSKPRQQKITRGEDSSCKQRKF